MMNGTAQEISKFLAIAVLGQLLILSVFLLANKKGRKTSNLLLAAFLSAKAMGIVNILFSVCGVRTPHVYLVLVPFNFLWGPTLYLYTRSVSYKDFKFRSLQLLHGLPFILSALYFTVVFHVRSTADKISVLESLRSGRREELIVITLLVLAQAGFYLLAAVGVLRRFRRELKSLYSSTERISLVWLSVVLFGFLAVWAVDVMNFALWWAGAAVPSLGIAMMVLLFGFSSVIVFFGLRQPEVFNGIEKPKKYEHSRLTDAEKGNYLLKLKEYMDREKPYLDPNLSINALSRALSVSPRYLSQVINESLRLNFFDFVNSYRVETAKQLLREPGTNGSNLLSLLLDCGFQTKSVFNRVFKKHAGMTPSEFKKRESLKLGTQA